MKMRSLSLLAVFLFLSLLLTSITGAIAASNTVSSTRLDDDTHGIGLNDLKPAACSGINLTNLVVVNGLGFGSAGNDLILGSGSGDLIFAFGGDDCIITGSGDDVIFAGAGTDVCDGGSGNDSSYTCETEIDIP